MKVTIALIVRALGFATSSVALKAHQKYIKTTHNDSGITVKNKGKAM